MPAHVALAATADNVARRRCALRLTLGLCGIVLAGGAEPTLAACVVNDATTITCSGAASGFTSPTPNVMVSVLAEASLNSGISLEGAGASLHNDGSILSSGRRTIWLLGQSGSVVNRGTITAIASRIIPEAIGIYAADTSATKGQYAITNEGVILGETGGVTALGESVSIVNRGTIRISSTSISDSAVRIDTRGTAFVRNEGVIEANTPPTRIPFPNAAGGGLDVFARDETRALSIVNAPTGRIDVNGRSGINVRLDLSGAQANISNAGVINVVGEIARGVDTVFGIRGSGAIDVENSGSINATDATGLVGKKSSNSGQINLRINPNYCDCYAVAGLIFETIGLNTGTISATGVGGVGVSGGVYGSDSSFTNRGTIVLNGAMMLGVSAQPQSASVINDVDGKIIVRGNGGVGVRSGKLLTNLGLIDVAGSIAARGVTRITNGGTIFGSIEQANDGRTVNSGVIDAGAGVAITGDLDTIVENLTTGTITGGSAAIEGRRGLSLANAGTINGGIAVASGFANIVNTGTMNGAITLGSGESTVSKATITNLGSISTSGTGAALVATGATTLANSGTITGGSGGIAVQLGATNDAVTLGTGSSVTGAIAGGGGTDSATLAGTSTTATATQTIARFTGFDSLTVASGYWTAAPANGSAFNRATVASGASLELANAGAGLGLTVPSITDNGTLVVRSTAAGTGSTFGATTVTGTGNVLLTGAGTVTLDGSNSLANSGTIAIEGGTTALLTGTQGGNVVTNAGGTFQIGNGGTSGSFTGNLVDNGTLVVARSDDYTFGGALTGAGSIVKQGAGKLTFGTGYAFTGTTTIQGGSIRLSTPVAATTELAVEGSGQLDLSGTQQTVAELAGTSSQASVNIAGGSLSVNQATSTSFAGNLTGAGSLTKTGTGTLNLTGVNSYTGPTAVNGGKLAVNGSVASAVTVNAGGALGGTGTVASASIGRLGRMTPGNSIGTLNVAGPVSFAADSIYEVEINPDGRSDRIVATGAATLAGGTVTVLPEAGSFAKTTTYNILTAASVSGQFAGVTSASTVFVPVLGYTTTGVNLTVARRDISFGGIATTPNQLATANAADALNPGNRLFNAVISLPTIAAGQAAFDALSGEIFSSVPTVLLDQSRMLRGALLERSAAVGVEGVGIWGQAFDTAAEGDGGRGVAQVDADRRGIVSGADFGNETWRVGAAAGVIDGDIDVNPRASSADVETKLAAIYGRATFGELTVTAGGSYEWHDIDTTRTLATAGLAGAQVASFDGTSRQLFGEVSYALTTGRFALSPFVGIANIRSKIDGFTETGTAAALTVAAQSREATVGRLGLRIGGEAPLGAGATLLPRFSIAYQQNWGDRAASSTAAFAGAPSGFTVAGVGLGRSGIDVDGGLEVGIGNAFRLGASYMISATDDWADHGATITASFAF